MTADNVVRLAQKTGGLFDSGIEEKATIADIEKEMLSGFDLSPFGTEASGILLDENSLDQFMDLSQFLTQESFEADQIQVAGDISGILDGGPEVVCKPARLKRSSSVLSDHDYIQKKPYLPDLCDLTSSSALTSLLPVTEDTPPCEDKYKERRRKNNMASRRSREIRKLKFVSMESESGQLEADNRRLEAKIVEMERLAKEMKAILVKSLQSKK